MLKLSEKIKPYHRLIKNFTSLSILQIANYLFPLIVLPYVVRILGPAKYGLINFAAAFVAYFTLISDYGFSLSGTKEISIIRNDPEKLSRSFSTILFIKITLATILFIVFIFLVSLIPFFSKYWSLYLISYGMVIGFSLFPNWFYQGIEEMKYITIIQVVVRSVTTVLIFLIIKNEEDFLILVILYSISQILIGIFGLAIAHFKFGIKFILPSFGEIKNRAQSGWNIFQSMVAINLYTTSNIFILGLFASEMVLGYFSAADKIRLAFQGIQSVLSQTVFPYVNNLLKESYEKFVLFIKRLLKLQFILCSSISFLLFIFSYQLTDLILGKKFSSSGELLRIISVLPLLVSLSNVYGIEVMLTLGFDKAFNKIISSAALLHIILLFVLIPCYFAVGTSVAVAITEFIVTLLTFLFVVKKKILLVKNEV